VRTDADLPVRVEFFIPGIPQAKGSMTSPAPGVMIEAGSNISRARKKTWRARIEQALFVEAKKRYRKKRYPLAGPLIVDIVFRFPIPAYRRRKIDPDEPHLQKPDVDKLVRGVLDPLTATGIVKDDCVVHDVHAHKAWCVPGQEGAVLVLTW